MDLVRVGQVPHLGSTYFLEILFHLAFLDSDASNTSDQSLPTTLTQKSGFDRPQKVYFLHQREHLEALRFQSMLHEIKLP